MKLLTSVFVAVFCVSGPISAETLLPDINIEAANAYCEKKWTKRGELDVEMHDYCMNSQTEGYTEALELSVLYSQQPWIEQVIAFAFDKWTDRDMIQYDMIGYTLKEETEGFLDIEYALKNGDVTQEAVEVCKGKWFPQFSMVSYCLDL